MPFDFGFDFRGDAGYVTDPSYAAPVLGEAYPHVYTNGDMQTVTAGFISANAAGVDRDDTIDPRLAGINLWGNPGITFQVDLPQAGQYIVDFAVGDASTFSHPTNPVVLLDNATVLSSFDGTNVIGATHGSFVDATGVTHDAPIADWDLVRNTATYTFATTTCILDLQVASDNACLVHLRLTLVEAPPPPPPPSPRTQPWIFTVADVGKWSGSTPSDVQLYPKSLKWFGDDIADGDELKISHKSGGVAFRHFATAADTGVEFEFPEGTVWHGMILDSVPTGELHIYF